MENRTKRLIPIAVLVLLTLGIIAVGAIDGWFSFIRLPWHPTAHVWEDTQTFVAEPNTLDATAQIEGSGIVGQNHNYEVTVTNIRNYPVESPDWFVDFEYILSLYSGASMVQIIASGSVLDLWVLDTMTDIGTFTPEYSQELTVKLEVYSENWHASPPLATYDTTETQIDQPPQNNFELVSTWMNVSSAYSGEGVQVNISTTIRDDLSGWISIYGYHYEVEYLDGTGNQVISPTFEVTGVTLYASDPVEFEYAFPSVSPSGTYRIVLVIEHT